MYALNNKPCFTFVKQGLLFIYCLLIKISLFKTEKTFYSTAFQNKGIALSMRLLTKYDIQVGSMVKKQKFGLKTR